MNQALMPRLLVASTIVAVLIGVEGAQSLSTVHTDQDTPVLKRFSDRLQRYADLHRKLEEGLPRLPNDASPQEIATHQKLLAGKVIAARPGARRGDLLAEPVRRLIRRIIQHEVSAPDGALAVATILESNVRGVKTLRVNTGFPTSVPFATVPPGLLLRLPHLPDELEYRFINRDLVLRDVTANLIVDYMRDALP